MNKRKKYKILLFLNEFLRLLAPFLIFFNPLMTSVLSLIFDEADFYLFYKSGYKWIYYHIIDKLLDYWWYIFILIYSLDKPIKFFVIILFIYRSLGQFLSIISRNEKLLLLFPNILERYFNIYILLLYLGFSKVLLESWNIALLALGTIIAFYIEWINHIKKPYYITKKIFKVDVGRWDK
ncbi:hypothetical protein A3A46_03150 [Candidatus Roizmanbacteria bacterium RIFCSPLOWO2_01_FULL_37_13]|uniref:Uncharacterized protein n=1 Tax=Candidatus Roizmanbacteria bacterium RIFCSPHIGHO2_02_FULL_38_11 TaxID=1802039 RepID=A0A1F7GWE5_9BACT|nr:MAG: hypothetical protein A3C25_01985 [Candidatus Roizmanbacteria bacterium RIFCSPHIGHO2_02_FULL_38_11]OGK33071.1 MAG: hypothetical protein A3F58_03510 [Candidatus Roizmanbacteria bacterium RIFCSPHIGHO2_12_FULL_37_9b]OGK43129.1 MAG: hypothetical protein A3A46_03150 [Candidatus Roizmanbacteria bacterium RIFCSPLOWO2_01_FULL_37_13]